MVMGGTVREKQAFYALAPRKALASCQLLSDPHYKAMTLRE